MPVKDNSMQDKLVYASRKKEIRSSWRGDFPTMTFIGKNLWF
jgi:hypothetical protein